MSLSAKQMKAKLLSRRSMIAEAATAAPTTPTPTDGKLRAPHPNLFVNQR
jgi:hypothetical protein